MAKAKQQKAAARLKTVADVAALQAVAMKTTARVGDPEEDAEMAVFRPILSAINRNGFVTIDSQFGCKETTGYQQRAYIRGFVAKGMVDELWNRLVLTDNLLPLKMPLSDAPNSILMLQPHVVLTMDKYAKGTERAHHTNLALYETESFYSMWINLLPELGLRDDVRSMLSVREDAVGFAVVDMKWGRRDWLFRVVLDALKQTCS